MADNQADDDDDEGFGDFKFVSYSNSNQNNRDDDDWGDFIDNFSQKRDFIATPVQFPPSNGFFHPQNPNNLSETPKSNDFFGVFSDHSMNPLEPQPNHVDSEKNSVSTVVEKRWEKLRGAIPLSIFGDEEEEPEVVNPSPIDDDHSLCSSPQASKVNKGVSFGSGVGVKDLIVNLYNQSEQIQNGNGSNSNPVDANGDFEEDGWEFKDAFSENRSEDSYSGLKRDDNFSALSEIRVETPTASPTNGDFQLDSNDRKLSENSKGINGQLNDNWFLTSDDFSYKPPRIENGFDFESVATPVSDFTSDPFSQSKQNGIENVRNSHLGSENFDSDDNFSDFMGAFSENGAINSPAEQKEEQKVGDHSNVQVDLFTFDDENKDNKKESENHLGVFPLSTFSNGKLNSDDSLFGQELFSNGKLDSDNSLFGQELFSNGKLDSDNSLFGQELFSNGKLESDDSLFGQQIFSFKPFTSNGNGINSQVSSSPFALNDLISNLYSQAEDIPTSVSSQVPIENGFNMPHMGLDSELMNAKDDFDENSWDFKDASSEVVPADTLQNLPSESKLKSFVDFYSKVKEESYFLAIRQLDGLKRAKTTAALSGEDAKALALKAEIEATYKKLHQESSVSNEYLDPSRNICMDELLEVSKEPKFQMLESEFHLSKRISLAENNLSSAVELFQHAILMVKILTMGSMEDQSNYVTTWSKMLSACAQELKRGASIWRQSLQINVHRQILSEPRGQQYVLALGEIYRVVEILRVSTTLYKPWILSSHANPMDIFALLEDCCATWSGSGLEEALRMISNPVDFGYEGTINELLESISSFHHLDDVALQNHSVAMQEPICRLSVLSLVLMPGMKTVVWNGEHYFLQLANLWTNRISCDPPKFRDMYVG